MTPDEHLQLLSSAVDFASNGFSIIPIESNGTKKAAVKWERWQSERAGQTEFVDWFIHRGYSAFAIVCGTVSNNTIMIELEGTAVAENAVDRLEAIARGTDIYPLWERLWDTYVQDSPNAGHHFVIRCTEPVPGNTKLARRRNHDNTISVLAETRGEGGYFIGAPSSGTTHPSGRPWVALHGTAKDTKTFTPNELQQLLTLFRTLDEMPTPVIDQPRTNHNHNPDDIRPGDEYNDTATWHDILTPHGWTAVYTDRDGVTYWRRPGKNDGTSATTGRNDGDNLYVFTTSTLFEQEKAYSKFSAYTLLNHNNDYTAAAKELARQGFGTLPANVTPLRPLNSLTTLTQTVTQQHHTDDNEEPTSSWWPVDLDDHLSGTHTPIEGDHFRREHDNVALLYAGRVHSFYGESESGKSWLAQIAAAQLIEAGQPVAYIDFEAEAADIVNRLILLGAQPHNIRKHLRYIRPDSAYQATDPAWQTLANTPTALIIIDGVGEALTMWGGATKDNDDVWRWMRLFPRALARATGAAVVTVDHVTKDKENRGRFAIGGQAKLSAIDGAAYLIEPFQALAPGAVGKLTMRVTKDRPGNVRKHAGDWRKSDRTQEAAVAIIDATSHPIRAHLDPPGNQQDAQAAADAELNTAIITYLHHNPGASTNATKENVKHTDGPLKGKGFKAQSISEALKKLRDIGLVRSERVGQGDAWNVTEQARQTYSLVAPFDPKTATESRIPTESHRVRESA